MSTATAETPEALRYDYEPHPKQAEAHGVLVDELLYGGAAGGGKLLARSTPVLTPTGWTTHGELQPGDQVYGHDGQPVNVLASYTPETSCHYLITFSTGETIRAGREHLWTVQAEQDRDRYDAAVPPQRGPGSSAWDYTRTIESHELADLISREHRNVSIPTPGQVDRLPVTEQHSVRSQHIYIISIEQVPADEPANCITVDDPRHIYLAGRTLIPTHNSRMARAEAVSLALMVPEVRIVLFRRTFPDLQRSVEEEMKKEIPPQLGSYNHSKHMWTLTNGSIIELAHLQREDDIYKYQGAEYALIVFEELTHFTEKQYLYLKSRLRVAGPVRKRMRELKLRPRMMATANPGGIGHHWVRKRFVDPAPENTIFRTTPTANEPRPGTRCYIPARVTDNPSVNPEYIDMLNALPETQRKALRDGDWDVLEGVRFKDWSAAHHVIRPEQLPTSSFITTGQKVIAVDYGTSAPFAALWMVKLSDDLIVVYREAYQAELTPTQQAELIRDLSADEEEQMGEKIPVVMDPSMWNRATAGSARSINPDTPPPGSPAHAYQRVLVRTPLKAVNERVNGWTLLDEHLRVREDGLPRLLVYETCRDLIRTLPAAPRDKKNPDDVDTTSEDHVLDAARYGAMHLAGKRVLSPEEREENHGLYAAKPLSAGLRSASF